MHGLSFTRHGGLAGQPLSDFSLHEYREDGPLDKLLPTVWLRPFFTAYYGSLWYVTLCIIVFCLVIEAHCCTHLIDFYSLNNRSGEEPGYVKVAKRMNSRFLERLISTIPITTNTPEASFATMFLRKQLHIPTILRLRTT